MPRLKSDTPFPKRIRLTELEHGFEWSGRIELPELPRLLEESVGSDDGSLWVSVSVVKGRSELFWITLRVQGSLQQECQRCLEATQTELQLDLRAALVTSEGEQSLLDEDDDFILIEEIVDDDSSVDLLSLIEDECLLALPSSPKHEDCEAAKLQAGDIEEVVPPNPFLKLAELKN